MYFASLIIFPKTMAEFILEINITIKYRYESGVETNYGPKIVFA